MRLKHVLKSEGGGAGGGARFGLLSCLSAILEKARE
jgi:glycerate kinase